METTLGPAAVASVERPQRVRAGGRSQRVRRMVAEACLKLLENGHVDFGHAEVADHAGVSRTTLYRWWPTRIDLLHEAMEHHTGSMRIPDLGNWIDDAHALGWELSTFFNNPIERSINAITASGADPEAAALMRQYYQPLDAEWANVVQRALDRGEIRPEFSPSHVVTMLISPLLLNSILQEPIPSKSEVDEIVRFVLAATCMTATAPPELRPLDAPHSN